MLQAQTKSILSCVSWRIESAAWCLSYHKSDWLNGINGDFEQHKFLLVMVSPAWSLIAKRVDGRICMTSAVAIYVEATRVLVWVAFHHLIGIDCFVLFFDRNYLSMENSTVKRIFEDPNSSGIVTLVNSTYSVIIKEEKQYMQELQNLKRNRPRVSQVHKMEENISSRVPGLPFKVRLKNINEEKAHWSEEKKAVQDKTTQLMENHKEKLGNAPQLIEKRGELGVKIKGKIAERNQTRDEFREVERKYCDYQGELRRIVVDGLKTVIRLIGKGDFAAFWRHDPR